jgi:hypothetical protein
VKRALVTVLLPSGPEHAMVGALLALVMVQRW